MKALLLLIPVAFFLLALRNKKQVSKLKFSGRVPDIHAAGRNYNLFSTMALLSLFAGIAYIITAE